MDVVRDEPNSRLLVVMENGLGKTTKVTDYRFQARGGTGVKTANITAKTGKIVGSGILDNSTIGDLILISKEGQMIRMPLVDLPSIGRATQGVYVMRLDGKDKVASMSVILEDATAPKAEELPLQKA